MVLIHVVHDCGFIFLLFCKDLPSLPTSIMNTSVTFDTVTLWWTPPSELGGPSVELSHYHIAIDPLPRHGDCSTGKCNATTTEINITGLHVNTLYTVTLSAVNCIGESSGVLTVFQIPAVGNKK